MKRKSKGQYFILTVYVLTIIVTVIGATFAYFTAMVSSSENAVSMLAAEYKIELEDDTSLIKTKLIPSAEIYVDRASYLRVDENNDFIPPYEENGEEVIDKTACVDDNLQEICSIYTFTIVNPMTSNELPARVILTPTVNSFSNLYFKVVDGDMNVVQEATHITNNTEEEPENDKPSPIIIDGIDVKLPKAEVDETSGKVLPATATYSIIMWIMETGENQTKTDGNRLFAGGIVVESIGADGGGITGVFSAGGEE